MRNILVIALCCFATVTFGQTKTVTVGTTGKTQPPVTTLTMDGTNLFLTRGSGDPNGTVTANPGSLYMDTSGALFIKTTGTGNTGWTAAGSGGGGIGGSIADKQVAFGNGTDIAGSDNLTWDDTLKTLSVTAIVDGEDQLEIYDSDSVLRAYLFSDNTPYAEFLLKGDGPTQKIDLETGTGISRISIDGTAIMLDGIARSEIINGSGGNFVVDANGGTLSIGGITLDNVSETLLLPPVVTPSSPSEGMFYAATDHHAYYHNGTSFVQLDNAAGGGGTVTSITATAPIVVTPSPITTTGVISITGSALTKTDDTNVTLTLGGTPSTALLAATSLTLGWTGTLGISRGGFGKAMTDPNADRLIVWDDTDNDFEYVTVGTNLTYTHSTHTLSATGGATFANPTASVGLTAVNGSLSTAMRSDAAPPLDVSISPTWTGTHTWQNGAGNHSFIWTGTSGTGQGTLVFDNETASPAVGSGTTLSFKGLDSTTAAQPQTDFRSEWTDPTHATRKGRLRFRAYSGVLAGDELDIWGGGGATLGTGLTSAPGAGILNVATGYYLNGTDLAFSAAPGNSKYYGTNGSGVIGYYTSPTIPTDISGASYITKVAESGLSNEFALGSLATGLLKNTTTTGIPTIAVGGTDYADLAFKTISVSGQSDVVADSAADTLTLAAGSNVTITTTAGTDTITIASTGGGGTLANPTADVGLSFVNGSAVTYMRSDAAPRLSQSIVPTWTGVHTWKLIDATTGGISYPVVVSHNSSGTPSASYGTGIAYWGKSTTTDDRVMGEASAVWEVATDGSRKSALKLAAATNSGISTNPMFIFSSGGVTNGTFTDPGNGIFSATTGFKIGSSEFPTTSNGLVERTAANTYAATTTSTAALLGTVELGNASDTTLSRSSGGVLAVEGVKVLATNSTSGVQQGLVAVNSSSGAVVGTAANASGSSSSTTAGTNIATITAGGGNQFVAINGFCSQVSGANSQLTATITYSDSTTTTLTTGSATGSGLFINNAAITGTSGTGITPSSTKKITSVSCVTAGTGNTLRVGAISAVEIPQ